MEREHVCECCALVIANVDSSACRDYYGHTHGDPVGNWVLGRDWGEAGFGDSCAACGVKLNHYEPVLGAYRVY